MLGVEKTVARESPPSVMIMEASTVHVSRPVSPDFNPDFIVNLQLRLRSVRLIRATGELGQMLKCNFAI